MGGQEGTRDNALLESALDEFVELQGELDIAACGMDKKNEALNPAALQKFEEANNTEHQLKLGGMEPEANPEDEWDVETIVSTYSNAYNHPKTLDQPRIRISSKTGLALGFLPDKYNKKQETVEDENEEEDEEPVNLGVKRRGESKEERKARKTALKELKKGRRVEKKEMTNEFKKESELQKKEAIARGPKLRIKPL